MARDADWPARPVETTLHYGLRLEDALAAAKAFAADFDTSSAGLPLLWGRPLDVGAGNGLLRDYVPAVTDNVSLDPDPA